MPKIRAPSVFAAVRSATPGRSVKQGGVPTFASRLFMFIHNGTIENFRPKAIRPLHGALSDESYSGLRGTTDSEMAFAGMLDRLRGTCGAEELAEAVAGTVQHVAQVRAKVGAKAVLNLAIAGGDAAAFTRHSSEGRVTPCTSPSTVRGLRARSSSPSGWTAIRDGR